MLQLLHLITCLHCWTKFPPEDIVFQSEHRDLLGDPILGENGQLRFLPSRFDVNGNAIDARGQVCRNIACPHCHLPLPRAILEREPLFVSFLGTPTCGKSFYLAALASLMRRELPSIFNIDISDADTLSNRALVAYENGLFHNHRAGEYLPLADLIPKTQLSGGLYDEVTFGDQKISFPRPFSFLLQPSANHVNHAKPGVNLKRLLCLYDNAGEHFLPGEDSRTVPTTRHMSESSFLVFQYDPTQDPRFVADLRHKGADARLPVTHNAGRQEGVLREAAARIRNSLGMPDGEKSRRPLIVVLNKADVWAAYCKCQHWTLPLVPTKIGIPALDSRVVREYSHQLRNVLLSCIPELVYAAESFWEHVCYLPVSALGRTPRFSDQGDAYFKLSAINPWLVTLPFFFGLSLVTKGLIPRTVDAHP